MFFSRKSRDELLMELGQVESQIGALPNQTDEVLRAQALIETLKAEHAPVEQIDAALAEQGLPSVADVGRAVAESLIPSAKLHHKRVRLEKQLAKLS